MRSPLRHLALSVAVVAAACGDEATSPAEPRTPGAVPAGPELSAVTAPGLLPTARALYYCYTPGGNRICVVLQRQLRLTSSAGPVKWLASKDHPWIVASPAAGTTPTTVTVSVDPRMLPGIRPALGTVTVSGPGAPNSPQKVRVEVNQLGRSLTLPAMAFSDSAIGFCYRPSYIRACVKLEEHVQIISTGGPITWKAASSAPWIVVQPAGGTTDTDVRVFVDGNRLPPRTGTTLSFSGAITLSAAGARNSAQTIAVKLQFYSQPLPQ